MALSIGGKLAAGPKTKTLAIPRDSGDFIFHFIAITDDAAFDALCPPPRAPRKFVTNLQRTIDDVDDVNYQQQVAGRSTQRENWFFLTSIAPSDIKWEQVNMGDPSTYGLWREELKLAGFSINEINAIWATFLECNVLTDEMAREALNRFLASRQEKAEEAPQ